MQFLGGQGGVDGISGDWLDGRGGRGEEKGRRAFFAGNDGMN